MPRKAKKSAPRPKKEEQPRPEGETISTVDFNDIQTPWKSGGRPRKVFDYQLVEKLASIGCTDKEIAGVVNVHPNTIKNRKKDDQTFREMLERARDAGKCSLRRMQWKSAEAGNVTMQIWLGKQILGQRDFRDPVPVEKDKSTKHEVVLQDDTSDSVLEQDA